MSRIQGIIATSAGRSAWVRGWPIALLAAMTLFYFAPMLLSGPDQAIDNGDVRDYLLWAHTFSREHLLAGRLPLWNPHIYAGLPFLANPQTTVFYPPAWLTLPLPPAEAMKWQIALHAWLAGTFMFLLLRRLGLSRSAGLIGAIPWMFGGYLAARPAIGHLTLLFTATWLPLAVCLCEMAVRTGRWRWAFWTGAAMGVQFLGGGDQNCYYTLLAVLVYAVTRTVLHDRTAGWRRWVRLAGLAGVAAATAGAVAAAQLAPTLEFAGQSDRAANSIEFCTQLSFSPASALTFILPWRQAMSYVVVENARIDLDWELAGYVGGAALALSFASLWSRRPGLGGLRAIMLLALVLMLGKYTPIYGLLLDVLPGLRMFRQPGRAVMLADFALCASAGFGADWLLGLPGRWGHARCRSAAMIGLLVALSAIVAVVAAGDVQKGEAPWSKNPTELSLLDGDLLAGLAAIASGLVGLTLLGWMPTRRSAAAVLLVTLSADMAIARPGIAVSDCRVGDDTSVQRLLAIRDQLRAKTGEQGIGRLDLPRHYVQPDAAAAADVECVNGYWPVALARFYRFVHHMRAVPPDELKRHTLADQLYGPPARFPLRILNVSTSAVINHDGTVEVIQDPAALPRAWIVHQAWSGVDDEMSLAKLADPSFDPAAMVLLNNQLPPSETVLPISERMPVNPIIGEISERVSSAPDVPDRVNVLHRDDCELRMQVETGQEGWLVVGQIHYPGWRARIDSRPVALFRANYLISAVHLPAGRHEVTLVYDPLSVKFGLLISGLAVCAAGTLLLWQIVRARRSGAED